jgi:hypothetical protein
MPQTLTESTGGPDLCLSLPCHIFLDLKSELEFLGSGCNVDLIEDQTDVL